MKKIRMRLQILGTHLGDPAGCRVGDILEVDDGIAETYVLNGYAELVEEKKAKAEPRVEHAVAPAPETAAMKTDDVPQPVKREPGRPGPRPGPGRPRKS
jgi:hypothetical protein